LDRVGGVSAINNLFDIAAVISGKERPRIHLTPEAQFHLDSLPGTLYQFYQGGIASQRMGEFMIEALPIGPDGIHRAAEEMIAEYGPDALTTAKKRVLVLRAEGFESLAKTWDLIYAVLQDEDDSKHRPEAYKRALGSE